MATTLTIGGAAVDLARHTLGRLTVFSRGGDPTLSISRHTGAPPGLADPWLAREAVLRINGVVRFRGDVTGAHPNFGALGWEVAYQCLGLRHRGDRVPHTDAATGIDSSSYNLQPEDPTYDPARAGRTVGQVLASILTMPANGAALTARGIGALSYDGTTYTLPAFTAADCADLAVIPPAPVTVRGDRLLTAVESLLAEWAPNHMLWIDPADGTIRVLDTRAFTPVTFTMGVDPVDPTELARDLTECYQRVAVRGQPIAVMALLKLSQGHLTENFAHDNLTNAQAKSAWKPSDWKAPGVSQDSGTVACPSTTTLTYTSTLGNVSWSANFWDQATGRAGTVNVSATAIGGYTQFWAARILSNTALGAGGSCTLTIDNPLPHTSFDRATISGLAAGGSVVWTQYRVTNTALWPRITNQATYAQPFVNPTGGVSLTSSPMALILRADGVVAPMGFTFNSVTGNIRFSAPTYITGNNRAPADIWVLLPVWTDPNQAVRPADAGGVAQYAGTSHDADGMAETLILTMDSWRDPAQLAQVQAYATDVLDSVKDAVVEGTITYHGLYEAALAPGLAASVAGSDYATGWEAARLPVVGVELEWPPAGPTSWITTLHCSNRRAHGSAAAYLRPERRWLAFGAEEPIMGAAGADYAESVGAAPPGMAGVHMTSPLALLPGGDEYTNLPTAPEDLGVPTSPGDYIGGPAGDDGTGLPEDEY